MAKKKARRLSTLNSREWSGIERTDAQGSTRCDDSQAENGLDVRNYSWICGKPDIPDAPGTRQDEPLTHSSSSSGFQIKEDIVPPSTSFT